MSKQIGLCCSEASITLTPTAEVVVRYLTQVGELHADGLFAAGFSGAKVDAHCPQVEGSRTPAPPLSFQFVPYGNTKMQVGRCH